MALFKILKGNKSGLDSQNITNGYCYVTLDEQKMYIDHIDNNGTGTRFCLNADHADTADTANKLDCGNIGNSTVPVYFASGVPQTCTSLSLNTSGNAATATTATALSSNAGSLTQPIYFTGGKPAACGSSLNVSVTGSSGSCTGNAATATKLSSAKTITLTGDVSGSVNFDGGSNVSITTTVADNSHNHSYLPLSGGTMTGAINFNGNGVCKIANGGNDLSPTVGGDLANVIIDSWYGISFTTTCDSTYKGKTAIGFDCRNGIVRAAQVYGAVWNDYAEYRICNEDFKPGQVVYEVGDDTMNISTNRLQRGCSIISDTFGFAIGETDEAKCPIAVSGRVLAYGYESREEFKKHIGWPVCSGPNGTVSIMTEEEEEKYPSRIIGTISAVPEYETWGTGNVPVHERIWIKIK